MTSLAWMASCNDEHNFGQADGGNDTDADTDGDADVCARWQADRADLSEGDWDGDSASCTPGDISDVGRNNALKMVNLYRWLADLPEVSTDTSRDGMAQECSLMMHAAGELSHTPDTDWACYTQDGADAAGSSNLAGAPGVIAVDLYMIDPGNENTMGHRRWILSDGLGPIGLGSTTQYSCMWVLGGSGGAQSEWTAWPPEGESPLEIISPPGSWSSLDETGWTIQSDTVDLSSAQVAVQGGGQDLEVVTTYLAQGYGSFHALKFVPDGWTSQADTTYTVQITGIDTPIAYDVTLLSCQ